MKLPVTRLLNDTEVLPPTLHPIVSKHDAYVAPD